MPLGPSDNTKLTTERPILPILPEMPETEKEIFKSNMDESNSVFITNPQSEDRSTSFFAQPGILAGNYNIFY